MDDMLTIRGLKRYVDTSCRVLKTGNVSAFLAAPTTPDEGTAREVLMDICPYQTGATNREELLPRIRVAESIIMSEEDAK